MTVDSAVLIADDDPIFRSLVAKRIEMLGARPIEASNGTEAWQLLMSNRVDLALIDIDMPGMTGVELINCIRGYPRTKHLPAVVITSISRSEMVRAALGAGGTAYLTKPLQWTMFGGYVGQLLETSRRSRAAEAELERHRRETEALIAACRAEIVGVAQRAVAHAATGNPGAHLQALPHEITAVVDTLQRRVSALAAAGDGKSVAA